MNHRFHPTDRHRLRWRRPLLAALGLALAGLMLLPPGPATAHVHATADNPTSGGFSAVTFRVPNESDTAGTVKLSVALPTETPFVYVSTKPVPGWTVTARKEKLPEPYDHDGTTITEAVQTVTWTADQGTQIAPGEYQEFAISVGPLPDPGTILLPAIQTYGDGTVVAWDQPTPASGEEPEHPAPMIEVAAATGSDHDGGQASPSTDPAADPGGDPGSAATGPDPVARTLGALGLVAAAGALVVAVLAWRRAA
jgi:uncharacterized protein YcnI